MNINLTSIFGTLLFLYFSTFCKAEESKNTFLIPLKNNEKLSVQVCSNSIFHIRLSDNGLFPQSLMDRYGILKTEWPVFVVQSKTEKENQIIETAEFQLIVNKLTGELSVKNLKGEKVISKIFCRIKDASMANKLRLSLESYFGKSKTGGGIIGDANYTGRAFDSIQISKQISPSVLEVSLSPEERFYGGGNTSRKNIQHRGEALRIWATYQKTEIPMPFIMSSEGWGLFNNTTSMNYFDIGRFQNDKMFIYNTGGDVDYYLMLGGSMAKVIDQYTTITGKPYLLPKWAYGLAFGSNMMENQFDVLNDAVRFRDEKIPCDVYWLEPQWMSKFYDFSTKQNWDLTKFMAEPFWEVDKYPKYEEKTLFVAKLHNLGYKLALWLGVDHDLSIAEEDHIAKKSGKPQSGQEHWFSHLTNFMDQGVDGFKLDPGRTLDEHPGMSYYNGFTDFEMHNLNQVLLSKQMNETFREHKGIRSFHHYCGGYAGSQHWGASTSGDNGGGKDALFDQLNLGLSGFTNTSADVEESKECLHLGFFLPWVQVNSWYGMLQPWYLNPLEKEAFRYYAQLRYSLAPYIYSAALQGSQSGMPILRALPLIFPNDRKVDNMIYQFMFGENLLVGVFSDSIYLPKGNWINYWSGEKIAGGKTVHCKIPENRGGPLFIKAGAIIPYQKPMQYIGELPVDTLILRVYPENKSSYTLLEDDGVSFDFEKGNIAKTRFECNASAQKTEFTIYPAEGLYSGICKTRAYILEIDSSYKPTQVILNNKKTENWEYTSYGKVKLTLEKKDISEEQFIVISY